MEGSPYSKRELADNAKIDSGTAQHFSGSRFSGVSVPVSNGVKHLPMAGQTVVQGVGSVLGTMDQRHDGGAQ
jgi:hypothetical protein